MENLFHANNVSRILKIILYCCLFVTIFGYNYATFFQRLTKSNKREALLVSDLLKSVRTLKPLNAKEESIAGLLIQLDIKIRDSFASEQDLVTFCGISVDKLKSYGRASQIARSRLVLQHLPFVVKMTRELLEHHSCAYQVSYLQLILEGLSGLRKAVMRYNGQVRFITYSLPFVNDALLRGITKLRPGSFVNHKDVLTYYRACRKKNNLTRVLHRSPNIKELARELKTTPETLYYTFRLGQGKSVCMNHRRCVINDDGNIMAPLLEFYPSFNDDGFEADRLIWMSQLQIALAELSPVEKRIIVLHFGLDRDMVMRTIKHTAELMCFSRETVRKTLHRSILKIARIKNLFTIKNVG